MNELEYWLNQEVPDDVLDDTSLDTKLMPDVDDMHNHLTIDDVISTEE